MKAFTLTSLALALAAAAVASVAMAQQGPQQTMGQVASERPAASPVTLVYEREVFTYRSGGRRDPFRPLTDEDQMGPRFEQLTLQGVIYSADGGTSVALLGDGTGRVYRVRVGDVLGNVRVRGIGPTRVVMAVDVFGTIRQETLELLRRGGEER